MAKSKNHTNHNQNHKNHRHGLKKHRGENPGKRRMKGMDRKFLKNRRFAVKGLLKKKKEEALAKLALADAGAAAAN